MKRLTLFSVIATTLIFGGFIFNHKVNAQTDDHTAREEAEGKAIWEKLEAKQISCGNLSDGDFGVLGEYYMGQMLGDSHKAINEMMTRMHGEEGEEQIHIVIGKRLSGCNTSASFPTGSSGWMPMMNMMWGSWSSPLGLNQTNNSMMNFGFSPFGGFGWVFMLLWWVLIIVGIVALIRWLTSHSKSGNSSRSALDILKERYARGEINKQEFEEKKKDLN
jgi:putative membrane protein